MQTCLLSMAPIALGKFHFRLKSSAFFNQVSSVGMGMYSSFRASQSPWDTQYTASCTVALPSRKLNAMVQKASPVARNLKKIYKYFLNICYHSDCRYLQCHGVKKHLVQHPFCTLVKTQYLLQRRPSNVSLTHNPLWHMMLRQFCCPAIQPIPLSTRKNCLHLRAVLKSFCKRNVMTKLGLSCAVAWPSCVSFAGMWMREE